MLSGLQQLLWEGLIKMENSQQAKSLSTPVTTPVQGDSTSEKSSRKIFIIISLLVLLIVLTGGFVFLSSQGQLSQTQTTKPVVNAFDSLKNELDSIDVGAKENDLNGVDKDLQSL